jgi:kynurenine formamidase
MPRVPFFPRPVFERVMSLPEKPINVTRMDMIVHTGTHVDAPRHFFEDGPAMDDVPLDRLSGLGLVWPVRVGRATEIGVADIERAGPQLQQGDILVLDTGSHHVAGTPAYDDHPWLSLEAARWIAAQGVKMLAVDMPTPDCAVRHRKPGFDYPVHRHLMARGVLIAEHLTNLDALSGKRVEIVCSALNICGSDGAPARILARPSSAT